MQMIAVVFACTEGVLPLLSTTKLLSNASSPDGREHIHKHYLSFSHKGMKHNILQYTVEHVLLTSSSVK